jgi:hypothetical protein
MADEVFETVKPGPHVNKLAMGKCCIMELGELLCIFHEIIVIILFEDQEFFDMWVLREHQAGSWDLHYRVDLEIVLLTFPRVNYGPIKDRPVMMAPAPYSCQCLSTSREEKLISNQLIPYTPMIGVIEYLLAITGGMVTAPTMNGILRREHTLHCTTVQQEEIIFFF